MELIKPDININFVDRRRFAFIFSGLLILLAFAALFSRGGLNYGIDFAGGVLVQVRFAQPTKPAEIKVALAPLGIPEATVQNFGGAGDEFLIRTEDPKLDLQNLEGEVRQALTVRYGDEFEVRRVEMVGPKVGGDLRRKALLAVFFAILMIAVYISGRFEGKWGLAALMAVVLSGATLLVQTVFGSGSQNAGMVPLIITALLVTVGACFLLRLRYALGAIVALIHDVLITVGVFALVDKEFTLATVAALLTIIGYSLNDTIIIFDRIRENLKKMGKQEVETTINSSINQTLSRTIITSGTTLVVLICLFVLGGGVIRDFAFALMVGVVVGTYSSVFVASPVLLALPEGRAGFLPGMGRAPKRSARAVASEPEAGTPALPRRGAARRGSKPSKVSTAPRRNKKTRGKKRKKKRR